jgi:hypothetical protein
MYRMEHMAAWLMALVAIVLGVVGALEAFEYINIGETNLTAATGIEPRTDANMFADAALFLLPAIIAGLLAFTLHSNEHHELGGDMGRASGNEPTMGDGLAGEDNLFMGEHTAAYAMALATIAMTIVGILTGFRVLKETHTFYDGLTWLLLATGGGVLTNTLHNVGHHLPSRAPRYVTTQETSRGTTTGRPSINTR